MFFGFLQYLFQNFSKKFCFLGKDLAKSGSFSSFWHDAQTDTAAIVHVQRDRARLGDGGVGGKIHLERDGDRTQGALEAFYAKYGFVGSDLTKYLTGDKKFETDYVHQNIHGALLISSQTLKDLQGSGLPLLDHIVTYELDEVALLCNTLTEAGVTFTDPRK